MRIVLFIFISVAVYSCTGNSNRNNTESNFLFIDSTKDQTIKPLNISIKELTRNINQNDGKLVEVEGMGWFEFENVSICAKSDANNNSCYWLDWDRGLAITDSAMRYLSGKRINIKGIVNAKEHGHFGAYKGTILVYSLKSVQ